VIILVLGGARSGKSEAAERMAARLGEEVTFLATGAADDDDDMTERIAAHRRRRPPTWATVEVDDGLGPHLLEVDGPVLVDALGTWLARQAGFQVDADELCDALVRRQGDTVVVSEEVGLGVHPATDAGRRYRDALGTLNQRVAAVADDVFLVVAGRVLRLGLA
jgi:adenosyl cobinamide kinase/adenosyl cobinamide phosphate guanylyltransferase